MNKIKRALISLSDKTGIETFARELHKMGVEIISTGGTESLLKKAGIPVRNISELTGFPEILDGRVKTLHPKVHGALLARRKLAGHMETVEKYDIKLIDMVVVNLYPFEKAISKADVDLAEAVENIDIGGPTMLRSAAKNYEDVVVIVNPERYNTVIEEMKKTGGSVSAETKFELAKEVFAHTSRYDTIISQYLSELPVVAAGFSLRKTTQPEGCGYQVDTDKFPCELSFKLQKSYDLRYGENPHQKASFYIENNAPMGSLAKAKKIQGKELSFNNILDLDAAWRLSLEFSEPVSVVMKHNNPCGTAVNENLLNAYCLARETDPVSAFGSVLAFNREVDKDLAAEIINTFVEAIAAPSFSKEALELFARKQGIRLMEMGEEKLNKASDPYDMKKVAGGFLMQDRDWGSVSEKDLKVVTKRKPTKEETESLLFAWKVTKHVKSNAIIFTKKDRTIGIGAGQMSRVDSCKIAVLKAKTSNLEIKGTVVGSDAFFPFSDGVEEIAKAGATAIIQPGGSIRDDEIIAAADKYNLAMILTGMRHFRH
ncbi:MAG: bifunctional phosphoribosylaminoimidazolecarboxamide formyltransferase/IMP cyclohydrolase [bacterium]